MSLGKERGETLFKRTEGNGPLIYPVSHNRVQMALAKEAFPEEANPLISWLEESGRGDSMSSRFRAYIEDPANKNLGDIDTHDLSALAALLSAIKAHDPETIH